MVVRRIVPAPRHEVGGMRYIPLSFVNVYRLPLPSMRRVIGAAKAKKLDGEVGMDDNVIRLLVKETCATNTRRFNSEMVVVDIKWKYGWKQNHLGWHTDIESMRVYECLEVIGKMEARR